MSKLTTIGVIAKKYNLSTDTLYQRTKKLEIKIAKRDRNIRYYHESDLEKAANYYNNSQEKGLITIQDAHYKYRLKHEYLRSVIKSKLVMPVKKIGAQSFYKEHELDQLFIKDFVPANSIHVLRMNFITRRVA